MGWTKNFGKPEGAIGKMVLKSMNTGHTPISKWGLSHYDFQPDTVALDIGCGGGVNIKRILELCPKGKAAGIDISDESVRKSIQINSENIGTRCDIKKGSAESIPYCNDKFDVVTAFETIYFWTDIPQAFAEVQRVLKPGGTYMVICEMSDPGSIWKKMVKGMNIYTSEQMEKFFRESGFLNIKVEHAEKVWICVKGEKAECA